MRAETLADASLPRLSDYLTASSFLMPDLLLPDSAWLEHAPFAFWLVDALRPKQIVELGCFSGFSYSVFCQAVQTLRLDTRCSAIDTWLGDEHTGFYGLEVFKTFNAYNEAHFGSFSQLIRTDFDEARQYFADGSIDLLHIDGKHSYDAVKSDYGDWRSKVSDRGIVLFHDTNVRERGFGVARLWLELSQECRSFEFLHGHGLGVLAVGGNLPAAVETLFRSASDPAFVRQVRHVYSRLGQSVADAARRPVLDAKIRQLETGSAPAMRDHSAKMARLEADLARQIRRHNFLAAVASQRAAEIEVAAKRLAEHEEELASARAENDRLLAHHAAEVEKLNAVLTAAQTHGENLQRYIDGLHRSTSWRVTRPLRGIARMLRASR